MLAERKIPIIIGQMPQLGATAPMSFAGAAVVSTAENLAGLVLAQLVRPGAPYVLGIFVCPLDMVTARVTYGSPEFAMGNIVDVAMGEYYGLPTFGWGGCSDSKVPDAQAGAEVMMNSLMAALSGVNLIHDYGYLAGGSIGSLELAVISDEVAGMVSRIVKGFRVDDEELALDVIEEVGPGGHFLAHKHTLSRMGELFRHELFSKEAEEKWIGAGKKEIREKAKEKLEKIFKEHPVPIDKELVKRFEEIVKEAEREILGKA